MANPVILDLGPEEGFAAPNQVPTVGIETTEGEVSGPPGTILSSVVTGLTDVPIAGTLFEKALTEVAGIDRGLLEEMASVSNSGPWGKGLRLASSFIPELLLGAGAFSLGRRAVVGLLRSGVPRELAALAAPGAIMGTEGTIGGALSRQYGKHALGRIAARGMDAPGGSDVLRRMGIHTAVPKPGLERAAEITGGSLAIGALYGAAEGLEGAELQDALITGAKAAAFAGVLESAFAVGAKGLFRSAREIDVGVLLARTEGSPEYREWAETAAGMLNKRINDLHAKALLLHADPDTPLNKIADISQKQAKASTELSAWQQFVDMTPLFRSYLMDKPRERAGAIQTFLMKIAKTPDQMAGELGPAVAKVVQLGHQAQTATIMGRSHNNVELIEIGRKMRQGIGVRSHNPSFANKAVSSYQRNGVPDIDDVADPIALRDAFKAFDDLFDEAQYQMAKVGLEPPQVGPRPGPLRKEWPLVLDRLDPTEDLLGKAFGRPKSEEDLVKQLTAALVKSGRYGRNEAEEKAMIAVMGESKRVPVLNTSSRTVWSMFDDRSLNKLFEGMTFEEVLAVGAPIIKDPIVAAEAYFNSIARRVSYAERFGPGGSLLNGPMRAAAQSQGASVKLYDNIAKAIEGASYGTVAEQAMAAAIVNTQTATRMGLGVIPNIAQPANIPLLTGGQAFVRGLFSRFQKGPVQEAAQASAINDSIIRSWREVHLDPYYRTPSGKFADWVLRWTGFSQVERGNRTWAFHASSHYAMRQLALGVEGRVRGKALDITRRRFNGMGQDFDYLVNAAKAQPGANNAEKLENLLLGAWKPKPNNPNQMHRPMDVLRDIGMGGTRQTQFLPDKTRLPTFWNTPVGRVSFQFKTYALNQARLVRDQVVSEAAKGNLGPLLYMMSVFPLAGELVYDVRQLVKEGELDRPGSPLTRFVENVATMGGFGLASDVYKAAVWGPEQVYRVLVGPTGEDAAYAINFLTTGDFDRIVKRADQLPTYRLALSGLSLGYGLAMGAKEKAPQLADTLRQWAEGSVEGEELSEGGVPPTLQELQGRARASRSE